MTEQTTAKLDRYTAHRLTWEFGGLRYSAWRPTLDEALAMQRELLEEYGVVADVNQLLLHPSTTMPGVTVNGHASGTG